MKILYATFEIAPFSKVGGLADVMGSLPKTLSKNEDLEIAIFTPLFKSIDKEKYGIKEIPNSKISLKFGFAVYNFTLYTCKFPSTNINVFFIENKKYFTCFDEVYPKSVDSRYEQERFITFSRATIEYSRLLNFKPDIVHCNDWHTAMIPVYLKYNFKNDEFFNKAITVFSIHNLAYQGRYFEDILDFAQIEKEKVFDSHCLEQWGNLIWLKGAINCSDKVIAVSPTYAKEIQTQEYGEGLDWAINENKHKLTGILNGIDYDIFNPETDNLIIKNYSVKSLDNKEECKKDILQEFGFDINDKKPLIAIVSRLVEQKGLDLLIQAKDKLQNINANIIVLGTGEKRYEEFFRNLNLKNIKAKLEYKATLGNKMYAGADMFLMPSRFEPCGLSQLIALKYGTIPIVRATGGLEDTIIGYPLNNSNGFKFWRYEADDMLKAIECAVNVYNDKKTWRAMQQSAMNYDYSWNKSAKEYLNLYQKLILI